MDKFLPVVLPTHSLPVCTLESKCTNIGHIFSKHGDKPRVEFPWAVHSEYDGDRNKLWYVLCIMMFNICVFKHIA